LSNRIASKVSRPVPFSTLSGDMPYARSNSADTLSLDRPARIAN